MNGDDNTAKLIIVAMADALGIELSEDSQQMVAMHLRIALEMSPAFMEFPLPDDAEPAPVFAP